MSTTEDEPCPFCAIVRGEIDAVVLHREASVVAFMDKNPINPGHVLVIPNEHVAHLQDLAEERYVELMKIARRISRAANAAYSPPKMGLAVAGFDVPHAHLHVIPLHDYHDLTSSRYLRDGRLHEGGGAGHEKPTLEGLVVEAEKIARGMFESTSERYFHGTKADLAPGDSIEAGHPSNFGKRNKAAFVYLTATLDAAIWGAELALGDGRGRIYVVEPTGAIEDDPNLTDKKFPGNPTKSYRTREPLRVIGEVTDWTEHGPEQLQAMKDHLVRLAELGVEAIED
jgi:rifampin ADP-ribosylating transferase